METALLEEFLPEFLLDYFEIVSFQKTGDISTKKMEYEIHLDERNNLPPVGNPEEYESKGFLPSSRVQDFPIRGKAVYLVFRKRRWRNKLTQKEIRNDYSFVAKGSKLTEEISDFLKDTGRYPRRYDK